MKNSSDKQNPSRVAQAHALPGKSAMPLVNSSFISALGTYANFSNLISLNPIEPIIEKTMTESASA